MKTEQDFCGAFKDAFHGYMGFKKSCGFKVGQDEVRQLVTLCWYLNAQKIELDGFSQSVVGDYLQQFEGNSASSIRGYECRLRQFALYLRKCGYGDSYVLPESLITRATSNFIPYVFSTDEIQEIFEAVDQPCDSGIGSRNRFFYQVLFRVLYSTGMRIGEVLGLKVGDVDLECDIITVLDGKGGVSRLVPFSQSLHNWLSRFIHKKRRIGDTFFFESCRGGMIFESGVYTRFTKVTLPSAGIYPREGQRINVHSIRHSFACHSLDKIVKSGADPYCALPYLATYLGHKDIRSTELYLRLTEERYEDITAACHHIYKECLGDPDE